MGYPESFIGKFCPPNLAPPPNLARILFKATCSDLGVQGNGGGMFADSSNSSRFSRVSSAASCGRSRNGPTSARIAAARQHGRVVQVGTQRKSTPHLIDVKKRVIEAGLLGNIGHVEMCCYFSMRANGNPPVEPVPDFLDYEMWTGPAPLMPYDDLPHKRWWRADFIPAGQNKPAAPIHFDCVYEKEKFPEDVTEKDIELNAAPATRLHLLNFLEAIEHRTRPVADIEAGHISTASCILANIAMQLGRPLVYDPHQRIVVGDEAATKLLRRPYRQPWQHPEVV